MPTESLPWILFRILHIGAAAFLVGSLAFQKFALGPGLANRPDDEREAIEESILSKWRILVHISVAILLLSGIFNVMRTMPLHQGQPIYHSLIGLKMIVSLAAFAAAEIAVGRSERAKKMRQSGTSATLGLSLVLLIVILGGILRFVPLAAAAS